MTILDKNTITLPNAQETYPNLVDSINEGLSYFTIPFIFLGIGAIIGIAGIIFQFKIDREETRSFSKLLVLPICLSLFASLGLVASFTAFNANQKVEKDRTLMAEHVGQHLDTEDNVTVLANTTGFDYQDVCNTILDNRESFLCGGEVLYSITWGDNDDIYRIDPSYDHNDTEDELIMTFNLKEVTEEQSEL